MFDLRSVEFRHNPYPYYKKLRADAPICRVEPHGFWAIWRHSDVVHVLKNPELFSSAGIGQESSIAGPELLLTSRGMLGKDRPDHTRLRKRLGRAFTTETIQRLIPYIETSVIALINEIRCKRDFDFVRDFSAQLPIMVICKLLGLDPRRRNDIKRWSDTLLSWRATSTREEQNQQVKAQMNSLYDFITTAIVSKQQQPSNDIISSLVHASCKEDELSVLELVSFIRMLLVAGTDTTTHLLGNTISAFIKYPEVYASIRANPELIPELVEESLRFDSPVQCVMRRAAVDTQIAHCAIRKDDLILAFVASANHDETVHENPHEFVITRKPQHHLTFGTGIHVCMGSHIARLQARIALQYLVQHFQEWQRFDHAPLEYFNSIFFRGLTKLTIKQKWFDL